MFYLLFHSIFEIFVFILILLCTKNVALNERCWPFNTTGTARSLKVSNWSSMEHMQQLKLSWFLLLVLFVDYNVTICYPETRNKVNLLDLILQMCYFSAHKTSLLSCICEFWLAHKLTQNSITDHCFLIYNEPLLLSTVI